MVGFYWRECVEGVKGLLSWVGYVGRGPIEDFQKHMTAFFHMCTIVPGGAAKAYSFRKGTSAEDQSTAGLIFRCLDSVGFLPKSGLSRLLNNATLGA